MPSINVEIPEEEFERLKKLKKGTWIDFLYQGLWLKGCLKREPKKDFKSWKAEGERTKPCHKLGFCPYGQLVEEFPLYEEEEKKAKELGMIQSNGFADLNEYIKKFGVSEFACRIFGHHCPVFYCAEPFRE